jgi:hypothetical protein
VQKQAFLTMAFDGASLSNWFKPREGFPSTQAVEKRKSFILFQQSAGFSSS